MRVGARLATGLSFRVEPAGGACEGRLPGASQVRAAAGGGQDRAANWSPWGARSPSVLGVQRVEFPPQCGHAELHRVHPADGLRVVYEPDVTLLGRNEVILAGQLLD